jgi:hypothetical protein
VIEGKQDGFSRKRKARDKANLRFIKQKHWILPGILGSLFLGMIFGGTVGLTISPHLILPGAVAGMWIAGVVLGNYVMRDLLK